MNLINFSKFSDMYRAVLLESITANPEEYNSELVNRPELIPVYTDGLAAHMLTTIQTRGIGAVMLTSNFKKTAKRLGISPTYNGINAFLNS